MAKNIFIVRGFIDFMVNKGEIQGADVSEYTGCKIHVTAEKPDNPARIQEITENVQDTTIQNCWFAFNAKSKFDVPVFNPDGTPGIPENGCEAYFMVSPYEYGGKKGIAKGTAFNLKAIKLTGNRIEIKHGVQIEDFGDDF